MEHNTEGVVWAPPKGRAAWHPASDAQLTQPHLSSSQPHPLCGYLFVFLPPIQLPINKQHLTFYNLLTYLLIFPFPCPHLSYIQSGPHTSSCSWVSSDLISLGLLTRFRFFLFRRKCEQGRSGEVLFSDLSICLPLCCSCSESQAFLFFSFTEYFEDYLFSMSPTFSETMAHSNAVSV